MESINLQTLDSMLENYKKIDLQKKVDIAVNINEKIFEITFKFDKEYHLLDKVSHVTGVDKAILKEIRNLENVSRKHQEWLKETETSGSMNVTYATMKKHLQDFYLTKRIIPTKKALKKMFKERYQDEVEAIFNKFFTTVPISGTQYCLVVEKPDIVMRRHYYLRKKLQLVKEGKVFVYIEEASFFNKYRVLKMCRPANHKSKRLLLAVSPELGCLASLYTSRLTEASLRNWLEEKVIPTVPIGCVFVFENRLFEDVFDPPSGHSSKTEMMEWLLDNDIPHKPDMHKAELYSLIETYKKTTRYEPKAAHLINMKGHTALCREDGVVFEYFEPFWRKLKEILDSKGMEIFSKVCKNEVPFLSGNIITEIQKEYWRELSNVLLDLEMTSQRKDLEVENLIDKLIVYLQSEQFNPEEAVFDHYCEARCQEYIFSS